MKIIVRTDNVMRDDFASLVQVERGDGALATNDGSVTRFERFPVGTYLIEMYANRTGSQKFYYPCPIGFEKALRAMSQDDAYEAMNIYVFA